MAEVLSQSEIDALLNAISDGDEEAVIAAPQQKLRTYDFRRPNKFSKAQLISLTNIYEQFSRSLATYLSGDINTVVGAKVLSIEQLTFDEFIRSLPYPSILGMVNMTPLVGSALIEIAPTLAFSIVECLLGGHGQTVTIRNRELTEIERKIIMNRLTKITALMEDAWEETVVLHPHLSGMETNPQFAQIVAPNEMVIVVTIEVGVGESQGMLNVCLPFIVMKPILEKLNTLFLFSSEEEKLSEEDADVVRKNIEQATITMRAFIGETQISVQDFLALELGDVVQLNQSIGEKMTVYVGDYLKFLAVPGLAGKNLAIQIVDVIHDQEVIKNE